MNNQEYVCIEPEEFPIKEGESWWVVHPNQSTCVFKAPVTAMAFCLQDLRDLFKSGTVYTIVKNDEHGGWITLRSGVRYIEMPYYVFARYFDAEAFIRGTFAPDMEKAVPFDYKPTVPEPPGPKQMEMFKDVVQLTTTGGE